MVSLINLKRNPLTVVMSWIIATLFVAGTPQVSVYAANVPYLPAPGTMVGSSKAFAPVVLKGLSFDGNDPFKMSFIIDEGNAKLTDKEVKEESNKLIRYFLAALTTKGEDMWVNLSPYESDRIVPTGFAQTDMGKDMLAQDYILKQLSASLSNPDSDLGKEYWKSQGGNANAFNKVWISPDITRVAEVNGKVFITESSLKVQTEADYLAMQNNGAGEKTSAFKNHLLPVISKEVNEGKNFAPFRQLHSAVVLAAWFKNRLQDSIYQKLYIDKGKNKGIESDDPAAREKIFNQYVEAFKQGVYNQVQETRTANKIVKHKYFSGGATEVSVQDKTNTDVDPQTPASGHLTVETKQAPGLVAKVLDGAKGGLTVVAIGLSAGSALGMADAIMTEGVADAAVPTASTASAHTASVNVKVGNRTVSRPATSGLAIGANPAAAKIASGTMSMDEYVAFGEANEPLIAQVLAYLDENVERIKNAKGVTDIFVDANNWDEAKHKLAVDVWNVVYNGLRKDGRFGDDADKPFEIAMAAVTAATGDAKYVLPLLGGDERIRGISASDITVHPVRFEIQENPANAQIAERNRATEAASRANLAENKAKAQQQWGIYKKYAEDLAKDLTKFAQMKTSKRAAADVEGSKGKLKYKITNAEKDTVAQIAQAITAGNIASARELMKKVGPSARQLFETYIADSKKAAELKRHAEEMDASNIKQEAAIEAESARVNGANSASGSMPTIMDEAGKAMSKDPKVRPLILMQGNPATGARASLEGKKSPYQLFGTALLIAAMAFYRSKNRKGELDRLRQQLGNPATAQAARDEIAAIKARAEWNSLSSEEQAAIEDLATYGGITENGAMTLAQLKARAEVLSGAGLNEAQRAFIVQTGGAGQEIDSEKKWVSEFVGTVTEYVQDRNLGMETAKRLAATRLTNSISVADLRATMNAFAEEIEANKKNIPILIEQQKKERASGREDKGEQAIALEARNMILTEAIKILKDAIEFRDEARPGTNMAGKEVEIDPVTGLPVGGITEKGLSIKIESDGTRIPMFNNIPVDTTNFTGFTFQITSLGRHKTGRELVMASL